MNYLICYDISCNRARSIVSKSLRKLGFRRMQKSVFIGSMKSKKAIELSQKLSSTIDNTTDSISIIPLSAQLLQYSESYGQQNDKLVWLQQKPPMTTFL